jgi:hypothetical protein
MKNALIYSLAAATAASAFAPAAQQVSRSSTALNEFCRGYVGGESVEPMFVGDTGSKNFDPLKFSEVGFRTMYKCAAVQLQRAVGSAAVQASSL